MSNVYGYYDRKLCACGCGTRVDPGELVPAYASTECRARWAAAMTLQPGGEPGKLESRPQALPPLAAPVPVEEVAEVQTEFAQRLTITPQVESALHVVPSGLEVRPRRRSLWKALTRDWARRVW